MNIRILGIDQDNSKQNGHLEASLKGRCWL